MCEKSRRPLRAWAVIASDGLKEVFFARTAGQAKAQALRSYSFCNDDYKHLRSRRIKEFDDLAPGPVTVRDYLVRGFSYTCPRCEYQMCADDVEFREDGTVRHLSCPEWMVKNDTGDDDV